MITKQEIMELSREFILDTKTIEKDYVLGWLLAGIATQSQLFDKWIFKGGTCLKKCYFETYRFSEDLDYTLIDKKHVDENFLIDCFNQIATWVRDTSGIEIPSHTIRFDIYKNSAGRAAIQGRIGYIGPLQRRGDPVRIKLDLTTEEILVSPPELRDVHHPYSDNPEKKIEAYCYSFPEVFAEKIRALGERARPRDLYDVIHLYRHASLDQPGTILEILKKKCAYKAIPVPTMKHLESHTKLHELESEWGNMLAHQLPLLPPREQFWEELPDLFAWLHGEKNKDIRKTISIPEELKSTWCPPNMIQVWETNVPLELIRFAGANHLCVEIDYNDKKHLIEPYDLKKDLTGLLFLIAVNNNTGEILSYPVDEIKEVSVTQIQFTPQYLIGLTPFALQKN